MARKKHDPEVLGTVEKVGEKRPDGMTEVEVRIGPRLVPNRRWSEDYALRPCTVCERMTTGRQANDDGEDDFAICPEHESE